MEVGSTPTTAGRRWISDRAARRLAWGGFIAIALGYTIGVAASIPARTFDPFTVLTASFPLVGIVILTRQPRNTIGWILLAIGAVGAVGALLGSYGGYGLRAHPPLPGAGIAAALTAPLWAPFIGIPGVYLLLLFPDGKLPSPRWRVVAWLGAIGIGATWLLLQVNPGPLDLSQFPNVTNPLGVEALRGTTGLVYVFISLIPISIMAAAVSLVLRFRRSTGTVQLQLKWLAAAAAIVASLYALSMLASGANGSWFGQKDTLFNTVIQNVAVMSFFLIPIAIGFAVLRHRLYDIDVVINKAVVYGAMALFITAVYVAIVAGIGRVAGSQGSLGLSILATALAAVGFQPVRERVQRLANRLVYGKRATPYEVLSEFSGGMAHAIATEELLPQMARIVAEGTGAEQVGVWLHVGSAMVLEGTSAGSRNGQASAMVPVVHDDNVSVEGADVAVPVRHQGELLGLIGVKKASGETMTPAETKLLDDLASQAGLVLRNVRLIEELKTSRQRLVTAQDEERRRLERDLHDGAQQRIVAIALVLRLARRLVSPDANPELGTRLDEASEQLTLALSELREFARGIHPAILTDRGLIPALESLAERSTVPTAVESTLDRRLPAPVEATAYFVVSEGLANVAKYSRASAVTVTVQEADGTLSVVVDDDGVGGADGSRGSGLRGLTDRVAVVDGALSVDSPPGEGTRLVCRIPVAPARLAESSPP